ncbi:MAG: WD40/YVTN/BNR-like repeat-containing protein, partial [Candidatus Dormibacteria bacterium]
MRLTFRGRTAVALSALGAAGAFIVPTRAQADNVTFSTTYVNTNLAGGEPAVIYSHKAGDLIYAAHEGTTLLYRSGYTSPSTTCDMGQAPQGFVCSYDNQINIWYSSDDGATWTQSPSDIQHAGFSDPDLAEDAGGNIYATGIDLANDALYSSTDGGKTWPTGTTECTPGDRQWVAGGPVPGVAWLSTNTEAAGHVVYETTNAGASCMTLGLNDGGGVGPSGTVGGAYTPYGKLFYLPKHDTLIEPVQFGDGGIGFSSLAHPMQAFAAGSGTWVGHEAVTGAQSSVGSGDVLAFDSDENVYVTWATSTGSAN